MAHGSKSQFPRSGLIGTWETMLLSASMSSREKEAIPANNRPGIAFRWVLPIAEILVCAALLWPWRGILAWQIRATAHAYWPAQIHEPVHLNIVLAPNAETLPETNAEQFVEIRISAPAVLNMPCALFGLARRETVPRGMLSEIWWIAGRGIEALVASRRGLVFPAITWIEVFVASLIIALGAVFWGLLFSGPNDRTGSIFPWPSALAASGLWIFLGGTIIAARIMQWRIRSRSLTSSGTIAE
jgi:hypothetical protein